MRSSPRAFTLIELLVVIAIIGILAAVTLASLVTARYKAADAAIKSDMHTVQLHMELYYSNNGNSYGPPVGCQLGGNPVSTVSGSSAFATDATVKLPLQAALSQAPPASGNAGGGYWAVGGSGGVGSSWAVAVALKTNSSQYWCVDSSGTSRVETAPFSGAWLGGNSSTAVCP